MLCMQGSAENQVFTERTPCLKYYNYNYNYIYAQQKMLRNYGDRFRAFFTYSISQLFS